MMLFSPTADAHNFMYKLGDDITLQVMSCIYAWVCNNFTEHHHGNSQFMISENGMKLPDWKYILICALWINEPL